MIAGTTAHGQARSLESLWEPLAAVLKSLDVLGPVSYTHLRAHETVLDLVCRLLLEKKKHNRMKIVV